MVSKTDINKNNIGSFHIEVNKKEGIKKIIDYLSSSKYIIYNK